MRSVWRVSVLLLLLVLGNSAWTDQSLTVTGSLWSPYVDGDLPEGGLAADLVRTALVNAGYEIAVKIEPWSRAYEGVAIGVYDVVPAVWHTPEREKQMLFSEPYLINEVVLLSRRGVLVDFETLDDLSGYRIGVVRDYAYDEAFDNHPGLNRVYSNQIIQNLLLLRQNKLELVAVDRLAAQQLISTYLSDSAAQFREVPKPLASRGLRLGVSRQNPQAEKVVADFNSEMTEMKEDGRYARIVEKHTGALVQIPTGQ